ncbi:MAG: phosphoribosyltransferase [Burkholderiaceae bacterium]|nr:MAG: phosphoribosyltransferase [Burkholderiaceae bacterium]
MSNPTTTRPEKLFVSWTEYHQLIEQLALQIHRSEWQFNQIVALARGGLRVGDVLSRMFDVPLAVWFVSSYREHAGTTQGALQIGGSIASANPVLGDRVLLVDDLIDTGATLQHVLPVLPQRLPHLREVRSAVLWTKAHAPIRADYVAQALPGNPWIVQPFEVYDAAELSQPVQSGESNRKK